MYRKFMTGIVTMIFGAVLMAGCVPSTSPAPTAQPIAELTNTPSPIPAITPTGTATPSPTSTLNATPTSTETPTPVVEPGTVRTEFARGEVMTKEEIKVNVDWFFNLSDDELNKIVEGNLFSSDEYPNDSRPRDADGNILSNKEDLGWFYKKSKFGGGGVGWDSNYFNAVYLGTTYVESDGLYYNISAYGSKDVNGNRIVIYASNGIKEFGKDYFAMNESIKDRVFSASSAKLVSERTAIQNLLNNYQRQIVMIDVLVFKNLGRLASNEETLKLSKLTGSSIMMDNLNKQRDGGSVDGEVHPYSLKDYILMDKYSAEDLKYFIFVNSTAVYRDN